MSFIQKLLLSIIVAGVTFLGTFLYIENREKELLRASEPRTVLIAAKKIPPYTQIDETYLTTKDIPKEFLQPGVIANYQSAIGQIVVTGIQEGEQILSNKLLGYGIETGASMRIPPGFRAVSFPVDDVTGVSNLVKPDDFIDVLVTFDFGNRTQSQKYTYTLFENIQVMAVNQNLGDTVSGLKLKQKELANLQNGSTSISRSTTPTYTVLVTPEQAQNLVLAQDVGRLTVSLRALWDEDHKLDLKPVTPSDLTGIRSLLRQSDAPKYMEYRGGRR